VSDQGRVQAQKLVDEVGGPELAKMAIDNTADQPPPRRDPADANPLLDALTRWETALLTPLVSGELKTWIEEACRAFDDVEPALWRQLDHVHPEQIQAIGAEDPEMLPKTEKLRADDQNVRETFSRLKQRFGELSARAERVDSDEARVSDHLPAMTDEALATIMLIRKQETAVRTWFVEAFQRDRGEGD
jgi:hypothetical protein